MKSRTATLAGIGLLALAGCSSAEPAPEAVPEQSVAPVLSVPETTEDTTVTVRVNPGSLPSGDVVRVSAFGGGFEDEEITCEQEVAGSDMRVSGSGQEQNLTVQLPGPGNYQMTLSAPGYSSDCATETARTVAKTTPQVHLDGDLKADGDTTYQRTRGKPFDAAVILTDGVPKLRPLPVEINVLGPYSTEPELRASQCDSVKIISSQTLPWEGDQHTGTRTPYDTAKVTIDDVPGLYLVTATVEETEQNYEAETVCDNYQSVMKIALEGK